MRTLGVVVLVILALAGGGARGEEYFTEQDFIRALKPEKTRSLTPGTGDAETPPPGAPGSGQIPDLKIIFPFGSAELTATARERLDVLGRALVSDELAMLRFEVAGHTDAIGGDEYNLGLSERRADAVVEYLSTRFGIEPTRLVGRGYGKTRPLAGVAPTNARNRRVEIVSFE